MAIIEWPAEFAPVESFFDNAALAAVYTDSRTQRSLRQQRANNVWQAQLVFRELPPTVWERLDSFLRRLRGPINSTRFWDFASQGEVLGSSKTGFFTDGTTFTDGTGFAIGAISVAVAAAVGNTTMIVQTGGGIAFKDGMKIGLPNDRLYILTADAVADDLGMATLEFEGALQEIADVGDSVKTFRPMARFYRVGTDPIMRDLAKFGAVTLTFSEEVRDS